MKPNDDETMAALRALSKGCSAVGKGTTVMDIKNRPKDASVLKVLKTLNDGYQPNHPKAAIEAYRYNSASIRIRIIDPDFEGLDLVERDEMVRPLLRTLPEEVGA